MELSQLGIIILGLFILFWVYFLKRRYQAPLRQQKRREKAIEKNFQASKHIWKPFTKKGLYYCNQCEQLMGGIFCKGMSECQKCGLLIHTLCRYKKTKEKLPKCKFVTAQQDIHSHQFILGNLPFNSVCSVCDLICSSMYELKGYKCIWCQRYVHNECKEKLDEQCDCSYLKQVMIKPNQVVYSKQIQSLSPQKSPKRDIDDSEQELDIKKGWNFRSINQSSPLIVVVNKKSGGQLGQQFLAQFYRHLNPIQVIDLLSEGLERMKQFQDIKNLKILVCGGDGTVASVVNFMKDSDIPSWREKNPPVGILPIGTGNDLGRALGWGGGRQADDSIVDALKQIDKKCKNVLHDRWNVIFKKDNRCITSYNYLSIGLDARVCYGFHELREKYPYLFKSRIGNKFIYTHVGTVDMLQQKTSQLTSNAKSLDQLMELKCDGSVIQLPECENIAFVNISSWAGGAQNLWYKEEQIKKLKNPLIYKPQSFCDGIIEVLGVTSMFHLGQVQININEPIRICQGKKIEIVLKENQYLQIDGEPEKVQAQTIVLERKDQVNLLFNSSGDIIQGSNNLQFESKILQVLEEAQSSQEISEEQKSVLLKRFLQ